MTLDIYGWTFDLKRENLYGGVYKRITAVCSTGKFPEVAVDYRSGSDESPLLWFLKQKLESMVADSLVPKKVEAL